MLRPECDDLLLMLLMAREEESFVFGEMFRSLERVRGFRDIVFVFLAFTFSFRFCKKFTTLEFVMLL